ncbi:phage tail tape measure protein, partial [Enterobacter hormaechei]|nr:tape measure protein [Enterobacter hormaechei]
MATLRELIIKISANSQSFQTEISRASRMGQDYYRTMQNGGRQAAAASRETQRALADLTGQLNSAKASAVGLAGAFAGAYATGHLISLADEWSSVNARLKQASKSSDDFKESQRALMDISQRTGTAFSDNASLFARSAASMREYGYSSEEVLKVTEAISTGLKLSGASTSEASSVITQFSQALAQGVLRGEEFNSVNENGDRVIRALASGMGVARKDLKAMADQGQLTADKVVPALISQLGALQDEYSAMPQTVASATTKIENAFLAWVGGANEATGATSALTGALNAISDNINTVASAAGVLAAIGGSRFIGGMIGDLGSQTAQLVEARKNEIALAAARANTATQSQRKAAADALAAERAYQLAQSELVLAKNTNAEATATQNAIAKRRAMITANAALVQSNRVVAASQQALNSATSVLGLVKTGATGLLGLVGGLPGLLMLGAGAWYTMYQNQEQARRSAQEYAGQIDEIRQKTSKMSLTETDENRGQTVEALVEQNRLVDEQAKKVGKLKNQIDDLNASRGKPGINSENDAEILRAIAIVTDQLAVEEGKLNDMRDKSRGIQQALEEIERRRNDLIREQAWRQNAVYQSMIMMNGQHTEFNRLLGLGNQLLMARQGLANVPLRLPQADLDKKQTDALEKSRRDLELSRRKGEAKERLRLSYAADDLGLTSDPQFQTGRQEFINNGLAEWRNNEANKPKAKGGKTEGEKTEDVYKRLIKQQKEQIALQGQNTELAKVKYQVSQGELASLTEAQKKTVLQNAALIDQVKLREQLRNYESNLADSNASARAANEAQLLGYGQGTRFRERLQEQFNLRKEFEQKNTDLLRQRQAGEIDETFYQQGLALNKRYLEERLRDQEGYYAASDAQRDDWMTGLS